MITGIIFKTEYFATFFLLIQTCDLVWWVGTFKYLHTSAFTWISFQMCKKEARDDKKEDGWICFWWAIQVGIYSRIIVALFLGLF